LRWLKATAPPACGGRHATEEVARRKRHDGASQIAQTYAARGEPEKAFEWLERARASGDSGIMEMRYDPFLLRYKSDPRYLAFGRRIGVIGPDEIP
jgi:hypothetical protein